MKHLDALLVAAAVAAMTAAPAVARESNGRGEDHRRVLLVPEHYAAIQTAVNAAEPGDAVVVGPGTYCEEVVIAKSDLRVVSGLGDSGKGRRPIVSGVCAPKGAGRGYGFTIVGTSAAPVANVEISGFEIHDFLMGVVLQNAVHSRVLRNEVHDNQLADAGTASSQQGILITGGGFNTVSGNYVHDNGHLGIGVKGSNGNVIRGNRLVDNQRQWMNSCSLMVFINTSGSVPSIGNQVVANTIVDDSGNGIMIGNGAVGPTQALATLVAGNLVRGHAKAGIILEPGTSSSLILGNDATGNGLGAIEPDLKDLNAAGANTWLENAGTCTPGSAGC